MDPLTAFGLAANVVAFVDLAGQVITAAQNVYQSAEGAQDDVMTFKQLTVNIKRMSHQLSPAKNISSDILSKEEIMLRGLAVECETYSNQLLAKLSALQVKQDTSKMKSAWQSVVVAGKGVWHRQEIRDLQDTLDRIGTQMHQIKISQWFSDVNLRLGELTGIARDLQMNMSRRQDIANLTKQFRLLSTKLDDGYLHNIQLAAKLSAAAETGMQYNFERKILEAPRFSFMDDRFVRLDEAHARTFAWAFDSSLSSSTWSNKTVAQWLESDEKVFWVYGDPGTGKSTFMKFLATHDYTKRSLGKWAGESPLVIASFYFFNLGRVKEQKSQEGLLRTLLYQVLRQCPDLIKEAFPVEGSYHEPSPVTLGSDFDEDEGLVPDLLSALKRACSASTKDQTRFCFFIDGLDEYEGRDKESVIRLVEILQLIPHVKICVSSRLWNEFDAAYGSANKVRMESFTAEDIRVYVYDELASNQKFRAMREIESGASDLVDEIMHKARGVFLWVRLVVKSLLNGLTDSARIKDLQNIVRGLPSELEQYFKRVLFTVNDIYRQQGARLFQITLEGKRLLPLMAYWYVDQEVSIEELKILAVEPVRNAVVHGRLKQMRGRLVACCKGLLRIEFDTEKGDDTAFAHSVLFSWNVDFYHRTVRDFLATPQMHNTIVEWSGAGFDADRAICESILAQVITAPSDAECMKTDGPIEGLLSVFAYHAKMLDEDPTLQTVAKDLRDILESSLTTHRAKLHNPSEYGTVLNHAPEKSSSHISSTNLSVETARLSPMHINTTHRRNKSPIFRWFRRPKTPDK